MRAIGKNLIVSPVKEEKKKALIIPIGKENVLYWKVLSVGNDVKEIKAGDEICITLYGSQQISEELDLHLVQLENVYAVR